MIQAPNLPLWAALLTAFFVLAGALITAIGSFGLLRLPNFYQRVHAPTLGATLGMALMLIASTICFIALDGRPLFHELLIGLFVTLTTPVTLTLLARASLYRDRMEGNPEVPAENVNPVED